MANKITEWLDEYLIIPDRQKGATHFHWFIGPRWLLTATLLTACSPPPSIGVRCESGFDTGLASEVSINQAGIIRWQPVVGLQKYRQIAPNDTCWNYFD